jgi:hypothetical protein
MIEADAILNSCQDFAMRCSAGNLQPIYRSTV